MTRSKTSTVSSASSELGCLRAPYEPKSISRFQIVPADGTNAAFNWREYGKPRWQLSSENYTDLQVAERGGDCFWPRLRENEI
jgi:hypothetical protein